MHSLLSVRGEEPSLCCRITPESTSVRLPVQCSLLLIVLLGTAPSQGVGSGALDRGPASCKSVQAAHSHGPCPERKLPRVNTAPSSHPPGSTTFHTGQISSHKALFLCYRLVFLRMRPPHPWGRGVGAVLTSAFFLLGCWGLSDFQQVGESAGADVFGEPWGRESEFFWVLKEGALGREGTAQTAFGESGGVLSALGFALGGGSRSEPRVSGMECARCGSNGLLSTVSSSPTPTSISPPPCLAPLPPPLPLPLLFSLVLSVLQEFLQALAPEEVTSYFGPEATLKGTCPGVFLAGGVPQSLRGTSSHPLGSAGRRSKKLPSFLLINSGLLPSP